MNVVMTEYTKFEGQFLIWITVLRKKERGEKERKKGRKSRNDLKRKKGKKG